MKTYSTAGTTMDRVEGQAEKEMKSGELCTIDGIVYERIRVAVGNGWRGKPLMRITWEKNDEKR